MVAQVLSWHTTCFESGLGFEYVSGRRDLVALMKDEGFQSLSWDRRIRMLADVIGVDSALQTSDFITAGINANLAQEAKRRKYATSTDVPSSSSQEVLLKTVLEELKTLKSSGKRRSDPRQPGTQRTAKKSCHHCKKVNVAHVAADCRGKCGLTPCPFNRPQC